MAKQILVPIGGRLLPQDYPDPEPDEPLIVFDIEIPIRVDVTSEVAPAFFSRPDRTTVMSVEELDLGVSNWRQLEGKAIVFSEEMELDASMYLATVHNPVTLYGIRFGSPAEQSIQATIDLEFDFRYVNPRPPELERSLRVQWELEFEVLVEESA